MLSGDDAERRRVRRRVPGLAGRAPRRRSAGLRRVCPPELIDAGVRRGSGCSTSRLRRHPLAGRARRPGPHARAPGGVADRVRRGRRAAGATWSASCSPAGRSCASGRPSSRPSTWGVAGGGPGVVPAVLRAGGGQRPRSLTTGPSVMATTRRQRPEGVVFGRAGEQLGHPYGPHRLRCPQARRHSFFPARSTSPGIEVRPWGR